MIESYFSSTQVEKHAQGLRQGIYLALRQACSKGFSRISSREPCARKLSTVFSLEYSNCLIL